MSEPLTVATSPAASLRGSTAPIRDRWRSSTAGGAGGRVLPDERHRAVPHDAQLGQRRRPRRRSRATHQQQRPVVVRAQAVVDGAGDEVGPDRRARPSRPCRSGCRAAPATAGSGPATRCSAAAPWCPECRDRDGGSAGAPPTLPTRPVPHAPDISVPVSVCATTGPSQPPTTLMCRPPPDWLWYRGWWRAAQHSSGLAPRAWCGRARRSTLPRLPPATPLPRPVDRTARGSLAGW